jgi:murein DD-endopeptidase MepM/ murein hydrolase activator NlpD
VFDFSGDDKVAKIRDDKNCLKRQKEIGEKTLDTVRLNRIRFKVILSFMVAIMVIGSISIPSFANEIDQAKEEKSNLEKKKEETELRLAELEKEKGDILKYIEKLDKELNKLIGEIDALNSDIDAANKDLEIARDELEIAKLTEENQYSIMKKRIQYMYENGESGYLDLILQSESLSDVFNHVEYMNKITEYDNGLLDKYKALKQDVIEKESNLKTKIAELNELKEELTYEQDTMEQLVEDKNKELVKYDESISETQTLSEEYSSKLVEQEDLIEDLLEQERIRIEQERKAEEERKRKEEEERRKREQEEAANNANNNSNNTSDNSSENESSNHTVDGFIWPVPSSGRITSTFGYRNQPTAGASTYHKGIDIGAPTGTAIVASAGGSVVTASYSVSGGNYIMIYHGNGTYTVYMHCSQLLVGVGDEVSQGDKIALVGSTGVSTGPHLHFAVSVNGTYMDPQNYVSY